MSSTPPDAQWTALVTAATLGTARVPPAAELARLGDGATLPEAALPTRMLRAAMAAQLWRTAGERTAADPSNAALASAAHSSTAASGSLIGELACWRLGRMLAGDRREFVSEWLQHANATGAALPVHWRPVTLDVLRVDERKLCSASLGLDADWLTAENPAWQRTQIATPSEERWQTGTLEVREAALRAQRALHPATARAWLESTWEQDPPEARDRFLQALEPELSLADEALLERALDDKRKPVRRAAAALLARMRARLQPLLLLPRAEKKFLGLARKRKLEVQLPAAPDKAAQRDGIELKPPAGRKIGERSFWLVQMLAVVPPAHWSRELECEPAEFLKRAASLVGSGVQFITLLALSDEGAPAFNAPLAAQLATLGVPAFACTPDQFPDLMAAAIGRADLREWLARQRG